MLTPLKDKQTAVEWLAEQINQQILGGALSKQLVSKAKEIERVQIIAAYDTGEFNDGCNDTAEQYYLKTYESSTL